MPGVAQVFSTVAPIFTPIESVFSLIDHLLTPVANIFATVTHVFDAIAQSTARRLGVDRRHCGGYE
jgi:hypothetical protein